MGLAKIILSFRTAVLGLAEGDLASHARDAKDLEFAIAAQKHRDRFFVWAMDEASFLSGIEDRIKRHVAGVERDVLRLHLDNVDDEF